MATETKMKAQKEQKDEEIKKVVKEIKGITGKDPQYDMVGGQFYALMAVLIKKKIVTEVEVELQHAKMALKYFKNVLHEKKTQPAKGLVLANSQQAKEILKGKE